MKNCLTIIQIMVRRRQNGYNSNFNTDQTAGFKDIYQKQFDNMQINKHKQQQHQSHSNNPEIIKEHFIYFISLVYDFDLKRIIQDFIDQQEVLQIIYINFQKVYFIFFELDLSLQLYNIYSKVLQTFRKLKSFPNYQTEQIIHKIIQPYFDIFAQKRQFDKYSTIFLKYLYNRKSQYEKLKLRYYEYNLQSIQNSLYQQPQKTITNCIFLRIQIGPNKDLSQIAKNILGNFNISLSANKLSTLLNSINDHCKTSFKWYNLRTEKVDIFKNIFSILTIDIYFQPDITSFNKIFAYVKLLAHILLQIVINFQVNSIIKENYLQINQQNHKKQTNCQQNLKSFNCIIQLKQQHQGNKIKKLFVQIAKKSHSLALTILTNTLIGLYHLCDLSFQQGSFHQQLIFNKKVLNVLDQQIFQVYKCEKDLQSQNSLKICDQFEGLRNFCQIIESKCFQIRYFILKQTISRIDQYSHLIGMLEFQNQYVKYGHLKSLFNIQNSQNLMNQLISKMTYLNLKMHKNNLYQVQIEKQIHMIIVCRLLLPTSLYRKYGLIRKVQNMIEKFKEIKTQSNFKDSMTTYLLAIKLSVKIQQNQVQQAIEIIQKITISKNRVAFPILYFICTDFYTRIHNSRLYNKYQRKIKELNSSNLFYKKQCMIINVEEAIQNFMSQNEQKRNSKTFSFDKKSSSHMQNFTFKKNEELKDKQLSNQINPYIVYQKAWSNIIQKGHQPQKLKLLLLNLLNIIRTMILNFKYQQSQVIKKYLIKYQIEQNIVVEQIHKNFKKIKDYFSFIKNICQYLNLNTNNQPKKYQIYQTVYLETIFSTRKKLIQNLIHLCSMGTNKFINLVEYQWQRFHKFVTETYLKYSINPPLQYFVIKCKVSQILFSSITLSQQKTQYLKLQYQKSFIEYFQKISFIDKDQSKFLCNYQKQNQLRLNSLSQSSVSNNKVDLEIYLGFLSYLYAQKITLSNDFHLFYTKKQIKQLKTQDKVLLINQLIQIFLQQFSHNNSGKIFTSTKNYLRFLMFLIQIGTKMILQTKDSCYEKQYEKTDKISLVKNDILVHLITQIVKFANKYPCSSYSSFLLRIFEQIKSFLTSQITKRVKNNDIRTIFSLVKKFQSQIHEQIIKNQKQQKLTQLNVMILGCQFVKYHLINLHISSLIINKLSQTYILFDQRNYSIFFKKSKNFFSQMRKVLLFQNLFVDTKEIQFLNDCISQIFRLIRQLSLFVDDLPFLMKQFARNEIYRLIILLLNQKKTLDNHELGNFKIFSGMSTRKLRKMKLNYFRSCRRGIKNSTQQIFLNLSNPQSYYNSFQPTVSQILKQVGVQKLFGLKGIQTFLQQKIAKATGKKIKCFMTNIE